MLRFILLCLFLGLFGLSSGLYFHIAETERKCFIEEIPDETMVTGEKTVETFAAWMIIGSLTNNESILLNLIWVL